MTEPVIRSDGYPSDLVTGSGRWSERGVDGSDPAPVLVAS